MKFKKFNLWTKEEDEIVRDNFYLIPHSAHHGSRFKIIENELSKHGFNRSLKSISRRSYRLGLKSCEVVEECLEVVCIECNKIYEKRKRFVLRDKRNLCPKCQKINDGYLTEKRKKEYHKRYIKEWRKKQNENNNIYEN